MSTEQLQKMIQSAVANAVQQAATQTTTSTVKPATSKGSDAKLLEVIRKFQSPARADGKPAGTFAVKVHSYFHQAGFTADATNAIVEDAAKRGVISKMAVPCRNGKRMMLYFDAKIRPAVERTTISAAEAESLKKAFGLK